MNNDVSKMSEEEIDKEIALLEKNKKPVEQMSEEEIDKEIASLEGGPSRGTSGQVLGNVLQGASLGFSDEMMGAIGAAGRAAGVDLEKLEPIQGGPTTDWEIIKDAYYRARNKERELLKKSKQESPSSSLAAEMVGSLAAAPLTSGLSAAKAGAYAGGLYGLGTTEEEQPAEMLKDTLKSYAGGAVLGGVLGDIGKISKPMMQDLGKSMGGLAEELAVSAAGAQKPQAKALRQKNSLNKVGRFLLDEGIVSPLASAKDMSKKISEKMNEKIGSLSDLIRSSDENLGKMIRYGVNDQEMLEIARSGQISTESLKQKVKESIYDVFEGIPEEEIQPALNKVDIWFNNKPEVMTIKELQKIKVGLNNFLRSGDFYKEFIGSPSKVGLLEVRSGIKNAIEQKADAAAMMGGAEAGQIKKINKDLGNLYEAEKLVDNALDRQAGNRMFSITDYQLGSPGAIVGEAMGGAPASAMVTGGAMLGNKILRQYGAGTAAVGLDRVGKALSQSPELTIFFQKNPALMQTVLNPMMTPKDVINDDKMSPIEKAKTLNQMYKGQ